MAVISNIKAKVLIQVGEMEPVQIGEVEIPVELSVSEPPKPAPAYRDAEQKIVMGLQPHSIRGVSADVSATLRRGIGVVPL